MYELPSDSADLDGIGVVRGALKVSEVLGLSYTVTCKMIRDGQIPGTCFKDGAPSTEGDLRTFTTTRRALKKYFDDLAYARGEATARYLLGKGPKPK